MNLSKLNLSKIKLKKELLMILVFFTLNSYAQNYSQFTDPRDGKTYKIATIDINLPGDVIIKRTWFAENLNYEVPGSFCYADEPAYCEAYGRLYTYAAVLQACPRGWKIPEYKDWQLLFKNYGGLKYAAKDLIKGGESGLNLLYGGFGDSGNAFKYVGISGNYWNAEKKSERLAGLISMRKESYEIFHSSVSNWNRNSCRCIKDVNFVIEE